MKHHFLIKHLLFVYKRLTVNVYVNRWLCLQFHVLLFINYFVLYALILSQNLSYCLYTNIFKQAFDAKVLLS